MKYHSTFIIPKLWKGKNIILHFGGVDWKSEVWINDVYVGFHQGGYDPFSFDITSYLNNKKNQKLVVKVWDPTDEGYQPRGKQTINPHGIWYTAVTGIWQTVWIEPVNSNYIKTVYSFLFISLLVIVFLILYHCLVSPFMTVLFAYLKIKIKRNFSLNEDYFQFMTGMVA